MTDISNENVVIQLVHPALMIMSYLGLPLPPNPCSLREVLPWIIMNVKKPPKLMVIRLKLTQLPCILLITYLCINVAALRRSQLH